MCPFIQCACTTVLCCCAILLCCCAIQLRCCAILLCCCAIQLRCCTILLCCCTTVLLCCTIQLRCCTTVLLCCTTVLRCCTTVLRCCTIQEQYGRTIARPDGAGRVGLTICRVQPVLLAQVCDVAQSLLTASCRGAAPSVPPAPPAQANHADPDHSRRPDVTNPPVFKTKTPPSHPLRSSPPSRSTPFLLLLPPFLMPRASCLPRQTHVPPPPVPRGSPYAPFEPPPAHHPSQTPLLTRQYHPLRALRVLHHLRVECLCAVRTPNRWFGDPTCLGEGTRHEALGAWHWERRRRPLTERSHRRGRRGDPMCLWWGKWGRLSGGWRRRW